MKQWYVIYTKPKYEYKVLSWFRSQGIEVYLPELQLSFPIFSQAAKKEIMFPCYIFAKFSLAEKGSSSFQCIPGVRRIVSFDGLPVTVPDSVINRIRQNVEVSAEARNKHSKNAIQPGTFVRIISGPFQNMKAIFERPTSSSERGQILLDILGSLNCVKIDVSALELISDKQVSYANQITEKKPRRTRGRGRFIKD